MSASRTASFARLDQGHRPPRPGQRRLAVGRGTLASLIVWLAVASSCIVFSEPAPVDVLLLGGAVAITILGVARPGPVSLAALLLWLVVVATGLLAVPASPDVSNALTHLLVTLYLAGAAYALAGYIAADPAPRSHLVIDAYTVAALIASAAAVVGFFDLVPGTSDLFTNHGRARGPFKDPNVFGAAIAPALAWLAWQTMTAPPRRAAVSLAAAGLIALALLLSFSRGAWASAALSLLVVGIFVLASARTGPRQLRLVSLATFIAVALPLAATALLQIDGVDDMFALRASLDQTYDVGPEGRFGGQAKAVDLMLDNPFGIGTHTFRERHHHEEVHNVYLSTFLASGWLGGFAYLAAVALTLAAGLWHCLRPGLCQVPQMLATSALLALALEGAVIDTDHWRHFFILQALVCGLADARLADARLADAHGRRRG